MIFTFINFHSIDFDCRTSSLEVPQRKSPATPRTARQLKIPGSDSDTVSSPNPVSKTPKDRSPKVTERKALTSPVSEVFFCHLHLN